MRDGAISDQPDEGRRILLRTALVTALAISLPACARSRFGDAADLQLAELERHSGGRLGVAIVELATGEAIGHRADERFGMCSTFKLPLAAIVLMEAERGNLDLAARIRFTADDMVIYAPVTEKHLDRGYMTVAELAEAAQITSDNVAANLLLDLIGGPAGFTEKLRAIGDHTTRLDRYEPDMNFVLPGESRDTTTPAAMAQTIRSLVSGSQMSAENTGRLIEWMQRTRTGLSRLRAGFPESWRSGDKTGTGIVKGMPNRYNDVAVAWPDDGTPGFVVAAYYEADGEYDRVRDQDVAILRQVGEIAATGNRSARTFG